MNSSYMPFDIYCFPHRCDLLTSHSYLHCSWSLIYVTRTHRIQWKFCLLSACVCVKKKWKKRAQLFLSIHEQFLRNEKQTQTEGIQTIWIKLCTYNTAHIIASITTNTGTVLSFPLPTFSFTSMCIMNVARIHIIFSCTIHSPRVRFMYNSRTCQGRMCEERKEVALQQQQPQ